MKTIEQVLVAVVLMLPPVPSAAAQSAIDGACDDPVCEVVEVNISTGYDHNNATTYTPVSPDAWWTLVDAPNTSLVVPSPAFAIMPNSAWATFAGSQWISAYSTSGLLENNPTPARPYSFERCICTCEDTVLHVDFDLLVDNVCEVYFDDMLIASQPDPTTASFHTPLSVDVLLPVAAGEHCLRIDVRNISGVAMGLNVNGIIETSPPGSPIMLSPACCQSTGKIIVCKFADPDCDGEKGVPPLALAGWTFTLSPGGATAVTDGQGCAYFTVPAGSYAITETPQAGWTAGTPASGSTNVVVATGTVQVVEFLNCPSNGSVTVCKYLDQDCNGVKDVPAVGLAGWTFTLTPGGHSSQTDASGCAVFNVLPGMYTISETPQAGWLATNPVSGSQSVTIVSDTSQTVEFVNCPTTGRVIVCKFSDSNCDGLMDRPATPLPGWTFTLTPGGYTAVTDNTGCATFDVPGGAYILAETLQPTWTPSIPVGGTTVITVVNGTEQSVVFLNCPQWVDLGCSLGGTLGAPVLMGTGTLEPNSPGSLDLTNAPPNTPVFIAITVGAMTPVHFKCGMLKAFPLQLHFIISTSASGEIHLPFIFPTGVPSGTKIYVQCIIPDASAPCGFALSNALCVETP